MNKKYQKSQAALAFSQRIRDGMRPQQQEAPIEQEVPPEVKAPLQGGEESIVAGVVDAIKPMLEEIKKAFSSKEVEVKIDGEMKPKEEAGLINNT